MPPAPASPSFGLPVWTLAQRELIRFYRQRTRIVGALGQPILFWILFGAGLKGSFQAPAWAAGSMSYQEYFTPGVAVMILMFTAIFSTISIIEDRREGFLQGVLAAPISRTSLVFGKLTGGTVLAVVQAVAFLLIGPALAWTRLMPTIETGSGMGPLDAFALFAFLTLLAFALTALGYCIAWPMESTHGFHAIMSVFLMPMWLLSGAFFPGGESAWLSWIIRLNPLTYGVAGLRRLMYPGRTFGVTSDLPPLGMSVLVTCLFCVVCVGLSIQLTRRRTVRNIR